MMHALLVGQCARRHGERWMGGRRGLDGLVGSGGVWGRSGPLKSVRKLMVSEVYLGTRQLRSHPLPPCFCLFFLARECENEGD